MQSRCVERSIHTAEISWTAARLSLRVCQHTFGFEIIPFLSIARALYFAFMGIFRLCLVRGENKQIIHIVSHL